MSKSALLEKAEKAGLVKPEEKKELPHYDNTRSVAEPFEIYFEKHLEQIKTIQALMQEQLSDEPVVLIRQLTEAERHNTGARALLAFANSYLDLAERQRLVPHDRKSYTDTDRNIELAAACSRERRFRDVVEGLVDGIERRISLGQSLLRWHDEALKRGA